MKVQERGVYPDSQIFFHTPSEFARKALYYVFDLGIFHCNSLYSIERNDYNNYLMVLVRKGTMKVHYAGQEFTAGEDSLVLLNCHSPHKYKAVNDLHFLWFHFDGNASQQYFQLLFQKKGCVFPLGNNVLIVECINQMLNMVGKGKVNEHFISLSIQRILFELNEIANGSVELAENSVLHAIAYIENHFQDPLTLHQVAQYVNLSPYYFSRMFKKHTSFSPYEYILNLRINYAKNLLQNSSLSIKQITAKVGFANVSHFVTIFKKNTRLTPSEFRELKF